MPFPIYRNSHKKEDDTTMKTLAIVGSHPETREKAPWDNPAVDIWVFNEAPNQAWVKRWSACFQLHEPTIYTNPNNRTDPGHWAWLQQHHGKPIYMQAVDNRVPDSKRYPLDEICSKYLKNFTRNDGEQIKRLRYFTNTIAYAISLAIYQGYERIMLFGAEMQSNTEYSYQRDNVAFWVGLAAGRGVSIEVHSAFNLFDQPLYGYDGDLNYTADMFTKRIAEYQAKLDLAKEKLQLANIALNGIDATDEKLMTELMMKAFDANAELGQLEGAIEMLNEYVKKVQVMTAETGKAIISRQEFEFNASMSNIAMTEHKTKVDQMNGQLSYFYNVFIKTQNQQAMMNFAVMAAEQHKVAQMLGRASGRAYINAELMAEYDRRLRSAGGQKSFDVYQAQAAQQPQQAVL